MTRSQGNHLSWSTTSTRTTKSLMSDSNSCNCTQPIRALSSQKCSLRSSTTSYPSHQSRVTSTNSSNGAKPHVKTSQIKFSTWMKLANSFLSRSLRRSWTSSRCQKLVSTSSRCSSSLPTSTQARLSSKKHLRKRRRITNSTTGMIYGQTSLKKKLKRKPKRRHNTSR